MLVSKRTTTLGALVLTGALANVWVMNMSYDVPVKLYSFHLLMSCVILLLPDLSRLTRVLLLNLPTGPFTAPALLPVRWGKSAFFLKTVFVVVVVVQ